MVCVTPVFMMWTKGIIMWLTINNYNKIEIQRGLSIEKILKARLKENDGTENLFGNQIGLEMVKKEFGKLNH